MNELESLRAAMSAAGLTFTGQFQIDDNIHRFKTPPDKEADSWYAAHNLGDVIVATFGCWRRQVSGKWSSRQRNELTKEQWSSTAQAYKDMEARRAAEEQRVQLAAREKCARWFASFPKITEGHMYLAIKEVPALGPIAICTDELYQGWLALPLQDETGTVHSAQFICDDGTKKFCYGGRVRGCYYPLSEVAGGPIIICEGYATGASLSMATGWTVICAMNCGNLLAVGQAIRKLYPSRSIIFAADNDQFTDENPGLTKANAASKPIGASVAAPEFSDAALESSPTDFNDLHRLSGLDEVRRQIYLAMPVVARPIGDFKLPEKDDPTELLRYRYLCERGSLLLTGPAGMGKSSLLVQAAALFANCIDFFGIIPRKPLKTVIIQAENDDGDIAQMRDGICRGLNFTEEQRRVFFDNVLVFSSWGITGKQFCQEVVRPLLDLHAPHLFGIDPALSFIGGDVKEQKVVGQFLREYLNPVIFDHKCACLMMHHTNKPATGREKPDWRNGELAYTGSGSAEWANWPRAVLALQSTGVPGFYNLNASKRGSRLAWTDEADQLTYQKMIAWSTDKNTLYWRTPDEGEFPQDDSDPSAGGGRGNRGSGRPQKFGTDTLINVLKWESVPSVTYAEFLKLATSKTPMSASTFKRVLSNAVAEESIFQSPINGRYQISKSPDNSPPQE